MASVTSAALISMHTSPLVQPGSGDAGGMNVYIAHTAREMAALGLSVDVFTRAAPGEPLHIENPWPGVRVVSLPVAQDHSKNELPAFAEDFAAAILAEGFGPYSVVHAHYWISGLAGRTLAEAWRAPLILTFHTLALAKAKDTSSGEPAEISERSVAERDLVAAASRIIVNTASELEDVVALYGGEVGRVDVIPPGVDLSVFTPEGRREDRQGHGIAEEDFHLLFVGRIQRLKGPQVLLHALAQLPEHPESGRRVRLTIIGDRSGEGELDLAGLVEDLGLESRVRLHPPVCAEELAGWYRSADAVAMPSYAESFGLVALEAQACGTPVIAADVGGLSHAVSDGRTGILVHSHETQEWAGVIEHLRSSPELQRTLRHAAPIHARSFGWQRTAMFTVQSYRLAQEA